jgi:predicted aldo/keto reductase-like oxidoreductase
MEDIMLYRKMKKNGDELSILGFGCMRLPQKKGSPGDGKIDESRATNQIRMAIDEGVNYIDTALTYHMGACEPFLNRALSDGYRQKVKLATKLPHWLVKEKKDMDSILNSQLKRLGTDQIDYYLIHALNGQSWPSLEALGVEDFFEKAKADGRIANAGFSFHGDYEAFTRIVDSYDWDFCQIQYNILDEENQAGTKGLQYATAKDLGVIVMEPLRGGLLAKKPPPEVENIWAEGEEQRTPSEWALRWVWNHPEVTLVLSGMNDEEHIRENIKVAGDSHPKSLSENELALIRRAADIYRSVMKAACTGCRYCMPCPNGVNIPTCFELYNYAHMYGDKKWAKLFYYAFVGGLGGNPGRASQCEECGECEEACPQNLPIQELLKEVAGEMEDRFFNIKLWLFSNVMKLQRWKILRSANK